MNAIHPHRWRYNGICNRHIFRSELLVPSELLTTRQAKNTTPTPFPSLADLRQMPIKRL